MQKTKKTLNLIALIVFLMSNFLNPISYAIDDLDIGSEVDSSSEASQSDDSTVISNDGDKSSEQEYSETPMDSDVADAPQNDDNTVISNDSEKSSEGNEAPIDSDVADAPQNDDNTVISNDSEKSSEGNETPMDSHVADASQNDDNTVISNDSEKSSEGNETPMDSHVADASQNDNEQPDGQEGTTENSAIDELKELIENEENNSEIVETEKIYGTGEYEGVKVEVYAQTGAFPLGTILNIIPITGDDEMSDIQDVLEGQKNVEKSQKVIAFDITFLDPETEKELQPLMTGAVQVTFNYEGNDGLVAAEENEEQEVKVYHLNDKDEEGEKIESITGTVVEDVEVNEEITEELSEEIENVVVVNADSFSVYTIVVQRREEAPESNPTHTWQYGEDYFTISIAKPSSITEPGLPEGITIMDRNLGATATGYGSGLTASTNSYGNYYQWGNNYGFNYSLGNTVPKIDTCLTWSSDYNNSGYVSKNWINGDNCKYDVWGSSSTDHYDGIWGWSGDNANNRRGAKLTNYEERQGPCPSGWHVPSAGEWGLLIKYWGTRTGATVNGDEGLFSLGNKYSEFQQYFNLPFVGYRYYSNASLNGPGSYGLYWSSSPYGSKIPYYARHLKLDSSSVSANNSNYRADGFSVRCFKNEYVPDPEAANLVDTQAWVEGKDFETITISDPNNISKGFTIMDRNLGATTSGTTCTTTNTGACGYKYQWGNNYGFPITANINDISTNIGLTWNNVYNNHGYYSTKFVRFEVNGDDNYDVWSDGSHHDGVRGGENDEWDNHHGLSLNNPTDRQGPCPVGYHVPSAGEWSELLVYWAETNENNYLNLDIRGGSLEEISSCLHMKCYDAGEFDDVEVSCDGEYDYGDCEEYETLGDDFADYFKLSNGKVFWSSSPNLSFPEAAEALQAGSDAVGLGYYYERSSAFPVRCFRDEYVMPPITVTFDLSGGYWTESGTAYTQPRQITYNPDEDGNYIAGSLTDRKTPSKEPTGTTGWMFDGWYLSNGARWTGNVTSDMTVYAHWLPFEDLPIEGTDYIIMDRNLGATAAGTGCSNGDMSTCGYHFQWGNNYGFKPNSAGNATFPNGELTGADKATDVAGVVSTYYSPKFITYNPWDNNANYNLWGGSGDSILTEGVDTTEEARQGPCPGGYHVPSVKEWDNMPRDASSEGITAFLTNLKLPIAGVRYYGDTRVWSVDGGGYYWSSTPSGSNAYYLIITSSDIHLQQSYGGHSLGHSVRCFKNTPQIFTITLNANGGELEGESSLTTDNEGKVTLPRATREPNENGERVFEGWFASTGVSEKIGNSGDIITPTADMDVYAHWAQTITIFDPTNPLSGFTIMDRNLGAVMTGAGPEAGTGSYGFHYQWGNNYGFDANIDPSELTTSSVKVNVSGLTSYYSGTFITTNKTGDPRRQDTWMETDNNDLWNGDQIQGPCPDGWHIPSVEELDNLLIYWAKSNNVTWSSNHVKINSGHSKISDDLYIPYAGARNYDASFLNRGNLGIFWSYSINGSNGLPYDFFTTSTSNPKETYVRNYDGRIRGISVRCFRDEYVVQCPEGEEYVESEKKCFPSRAIIRDSESGEIIQINDQEWDDLELYFLQSDGTTGHYTLMDRNMGATEVYNQDEENPNFGSLGYHYQWGNNYGFAPCEGYECSTFSGGETAGNIVIDKSEWENYAPSKYARNTWSTADNWMGGAGSGDNLRGGAGDHDQFSNGPGTGGDRQGPCPDGYHIPSAYEWNQMSNAWEDAVSLEFSFTRGVIFDSDFLMPSAGYRSSSTHAIYLIRFAHYWSSSPWSSGEHGMRLYVNGGPGVYNLNRSNGLSIRCMRNTNNADTLQIHANGGTNAVIAFTGSVSNGRFTSLGTPKNGNAVFLGWYDALVDGNKLVTGSSVVSDIYARWVGSVTFNSNGGSGVPSQMIDFGEYATQPTDPTRDNSEFKWWYLEDPSTAFDFEHTAITGNITLNAKWECAGGYIEKGETCVESVLVSFNTNGGTPKQSVEIEKGTKLKGNDVKYSHTSNIDDGGNSNGNYETDLQTVDVIKFPGSERLYIDLKYATQTNYDVLLVIEGEYNDYFEEPTYYVFSGNSDDTLNTTGFYISGDTVTFLFHSDNMIGYYGYYAVISGSYDKIGDDPIRNGYTFTGWYTEPQGGVKFDPETTNITENMTLYAHWESLCPEGQEYAETDEQCYPSRAIIRDSITNEIIQINDQKWDDLNIYFLKADGTTGYYTMMDRNMGATEVYNQNYDNQNIASYGYYYKWGNNYGFTGGDSSFASASYGTQNDWGQGPCPEGYHVLTSGDWNNLYTYWGNSNTVVTNKGQQWASDLLLSYAGRWTSKISSGTDGYYWSSSRVNSPRTINFYSDTIIAGLYFSSSYGYSVRCLKNSPNSQTLTLHANGGTKAVIAFTGTVSDGKFTALGTPSRENSVFSGWYDAEVGGNKLEMGSAVVPDLYARWECDSHSIEVNGECILLKVVTFDSRGGTEIDLQKIFPGEFATQPATNPTRDNSEFKGWYLEDSETAFDFEHTAITEDITLNAKWKCNTGYIEKGEACVESAVVTFDTNGGSPKASVEIEKGTKLKGIVIKYSHTPNIDDAGVQSGNYANYLSNNHAIKIPESKKLYVSLKYATEANYDYLYIFKGMYTGTLDGNMDAGQLYTFNGDSSDTLNTTGFYVDGDEVTFSFYSDSSQNYYGYYAVISGSYDKMGENPTNGNGEFVGWYLSGSDTLFDPENTNITGDTTLYAKWLCNSGYTEVNGECIQQFTVTLNASQNGGTIDGQGTKALTVASGSTFVRSSYTGQKAGYTFVGWAETSGTTGVLTSNPVITANKELFAVFKKDLLATFIIQDLDAATKAGGSTSCTLYNLDESCSITSPTLNANEGYTALGWNTNSGDTVSSLNSDTSTGISVNATYYSITKSNDKVLHISYTKGIGVEEIGETSDSCTLTGTYNGALQATSCIVTLPEIILRSGYGTGVWTKNTNSSVTKKPGDSIELTSNDSYTASAIATVYPISYHENGGTLVGQKTSYTVEEDFTLVTPNRDNYVFEGWTGSNGDNPQKTVTVNSGTVTGPLNYYANWTPITYTIAFNGNAVNVEGTQSSIDATYDSGDTAPESNFTRPGYTFTSWNTQSDGNGINYDTGSELKNLTNTSGDVVTLYAIWQANTDTPYTVYHYLENINDTGYTLESTDTTRVGITDSTGFVDELKKGITGAHFEKASLVANPQSTDEIDRFTIGGDGNTEVYLFYKRNTHTVTATAGEGVGSVSGAGTYKYGQTVTLTPGNINSCYTANSKTFTMPDNDVQETLNGVIKKFTVTLNKDSHISSVQGAGEYNCGQEVTVSATPNVGYDFVKWEKNSTQVSTQSSYTFTITESIVLNAVSRAQNGITYTVRHWIKDIGANTYTKYSEESKSGETDSPITLENEKIGVPCGTYAEGKENGTVKTTTTIKGDGSTVIDLYYSRNSYIVTTSKDSGIQSVSNSASHECGADVTVTSTPKTGYHFTTYSSEDVDSSTNNPYTFTMPDKAVSIQAQSNANTYTVNFNANGGIGTMSQQTFTYDISQQLSDNLFTRTGYIFTGWSIDSGATVPTYTNKQSVDNLATTGSITLYAIWTTKGTSTKYTVRHIKQGLSTPTDDVVETQELYAETNSVQTPVVNIYSGFNSPSAGNITVSANGNASIDYVYTRKNITLTLDKDNGTQNSTITGKYGANVQKPTSNPSKSGYTFAGWLPNIPDTFPAISGMYVAQYTLDTYIITYSMNGGINHADNPTTYTYLSGDITLKAPTRDGYVFNGWMGTDVNSVTKTVIISSHSEGNRSYTAIWGEDRNNNGVDDDSEPKYTVTINYVYSRGGMAAGAYTTGNQLSGFTYNVDSPIITNYHADKTNVSGTITGNVEVTVTYTPDHDTNNNGIADEEETTNNSGGSSSGGGSGGGGGGSGGGAGGNNGNQKTPEKDIHGSADVKVNTVGDEGDGPDKADNTDLQESPSNEVDGQNKSDSSESNKNNSSQNNPTYSEEFNQAYSFAYSKGITTVPTIQAANLNSPLTRIQMAKMLSYFAINVLGKDPDTTKKVKFRDVSVAKDKQYDNGVTLAYQLGIMGINMKNNKFRPNDLVTRAEFVTALSRLLYNMSDGEYKGTSKYYEPHMKKLYNEGIITKTNPKMEENRGYVMIMLMRSAKGSVK